MCRERKVLTTPSEMSPVIFKRMYVVAPSNPSGVSSRRIGGPTTCVRCSHSVVQGPSSVFFPSSAELYW